MTLASIKDQNKYNFFELKVSGIYAIVNPINRKVYIGSSVCIKTRMMKHLTLLNKNEHFNKHLQNSWNNSQNDFEFVILEIVENRADLIERERHWIVLTNCCDKNYGYNSMLAADSPLGTKDSLETKLKKSYWQKGRTLSAETRLRQSLASKGKPKSEEHKEKLKLANLGKKQSEEQVSKAKAARKLNSQWSHPWGRLCVCEECVQRKRKLKKEWRLKTGKN